MLPFPPPTESTAVLLEYDDDHLSEAYVRRQLHQVGSKIGASVLDISAADIRDAVWSWRRQISTMLKDVFAFKSSEDIVVPSSQMAAIVGFAKALGARHRLEILCYGHCGDGNIHVNILADEVPNKAKLDSFRLQLFREVIGRGGHLSGEHGIGSQKRDYMRIEHTEDTLRQMIAIKRQWDPLNVLNPRKVCPIT